jgi:hypothetical protein
METKTALQIINEALHIAITKGCFGLVEVTNVVKALEVFNQANSVDFEDITDIKAAREKEL